MAKYDVTCERCQSEFTVQLFGPHRDREWKLTNWTWICDECKEKMKVEASEEAAAEAEASGLPELTGTEKQIRWAEVIRLDLIKKIDEAVRRWNVSPGSVIEHAVTGVKGQKSASYWIEHRYDSAREVLEAFARLNPPRKPEEKALEEDAAAEATVRPERIVSETVAEIRPYDDRIAIHFPEKREDFWKLIKHDLEYQWSGNCWVRKIGLRTGSVADRAAEAGHRILAAGFPIRIFDESIRNRAVSGDYEPESRKWILVKTEGDLAGRFLIFWARESGDYYAAARRLPASRYVKPYVVVPAEHWAEVLDFAGVHGFTVSPGAAALAEKTRAAKDAMLTVSVDPVEKEKPKSSKRPTLEVPDEVEIPDDLKD